MPAALDSKWYGDKSFGYVTMRLIHEHASQTMMAGAFMILAAGQLNLHKNALRIAGFGAGVSICTSAGTWADVRVAAYYVLWSLLYASAYRKDELNAKKAEAKQQSTHSDKTVIETT
ncbi:hypothetical protein Slin14017_G127110 [Septoria linicola]|nr:hypothetical protein Slin14017_G127110 [Septoria linicola]